MSSLSVGKDSIILEEVKSSLYSKELRLKVFGKIQKEMMHIHARVMRDVTESPKKWFQQVTKDYFIMVYFKIYLP